MPDVDYAADPTEDHERTPRMTLAILAALTLNIALTAYLIRRPAPIGTFRTLSLGPEDLLVIQSERKITLEMADTLKAQWATVTGTSTNVIVIPPELDLSVIRNGLRQVESAA